MAQLRSGTAEGLISNKYEIILDRVDLHEEPGRSWAYLMFHVSTMTGCAFARAGLVWCGEPREKDASWAAQLFHVNVNVDETIDARGWGLPPECEPEHVTWLHPYGRPPWEPADTEEPARREWEQRFLARAQELLVDPGLSQAHEERLELRDHRGQSYALLTFRVLAQPGCTFAAHYPVWVGWPTPLTPETRAEEFHVRAEYQLDHLPRCEPTGLSWGGRPPHWFERSRPR